MTIKRVILNNKKDVNYVVDEKFDITFYYPISLNLVASFYQLSKDSFQNDIANILSKCCNVTTLKLNYFYLGPSLSQIIVDKLPNIEYLELSNSLFKTETIVVNFIEQFKSLNKLVIIQCDNLEFFVKNDNNFICNINV